MHSQGLNDGGHIEGRDVAIESRWAEGQSARLPELAADLVRRKVSLIAATGGSGSAHAAKDATATIPVLFIAGPDPVADGVVSSFNRPGDNLTGVAVITWREFVEAGGLTSYGPNIAWAYRQIGQYASRILKGTKPADLPVMLPAKFELVINLKTAKALGLAIPRVIFAIADQVIE